MTENLTLVSEKKMRFHLSYSTQFYFLILRLHYEEFLFRGIKTASHIAFSDLGGIGETFGKLEKCVIFHS